MAYEKIDLQDFLSRDVEKLVSTRFVCPKCGKEHSVPFRRIVIQPNLTRDIPRHVAELGGGENGCLIYDQKIGDTVAAPIMKLLQKGGLNLNPHPVVYEKEQIPPEVGLSKAITEEVTGNTDYLMSIGSGVISDLTKYAAEILDVPYFFIPTAPSMNGYTSSMAALTRKDIKNTLLVNSATGVFADTKILQNAPVDMIRSGLGDILSKSVCNADWKLSQLIKQTYFCPVPSMITDKTEQDYIGAAEDIGNRTESGIRILTEGIMRSGICMTIVKETTPSSGAEHLLSHYWDLKNKINNRPKNFHGTQVGVATPIVLKIYQFSRDYDIRRISLKKREEGYPSWDYWESFIRKSYGMYSPEITAEFRAKYMPWQEKKGELEYIADNWTMILDELDPYLRPMDDVEKALKISGAASTYSDLGISRNDFIDSILHAPLIRSRYTILDLLSDFGLIEEAARFAE